MDKLLLFSARLALLVGIWGLLDFVFDIYRLYYYECTIAGIKAKQIMRGLHQRIPRYTFVRNMAIMAVGFGWYVTWTFT